MMLKRVGLLARSPRNFSVHPLWMWYPPTAATARPTRTTRTGRRGRSIRVALASFACVRLEVPEPTRNEIAPKDRAR